MPGKLRGGDGDVGKLFDRGVFDHVAVGQEENAVLAEARVFDLQHHATAKRADVRRGFDGLEERSQAGGGDLAGAGASKRRREKATEARKASNAMRLKPRRCATLN